MGIYTRLQAEDIHKILNLYGLADANFIEPLSLGISNSNYKIQTERGENIILKVSNDKNKVELLEEQEILTLLSEYKKSLMPFKTQDKNLVYEYNGLHGVVFPLARGVNPIGEKYELIAIGKELANFHNFTEGYSSLFKATRSHAKVGFDLLGIENYISFENAIPDYVEYYKKLIDPDKIEQWKSADLKHGLIHGDLYSDNILFDGKEISKILDFEQAGIGEYLLDLGICISGCCIDMKGFSKKQMNLLLEGYESVRALSDQEKDLLKTAVLLGFFDISLWRIKRFFEGNLDPKRKHSYQNLLELAQDFSEKY
jgi:homoserine kinase type II